MSSIYARLIKFGTVATLAAAAVPSFAGLSLPITLNTTYINANSVFALSQDAYDTLDLASTHITARGSATGSADGMSFNLPITSLTVDLLKFAPTKGSAQGAILDITRGKKTLSLANFTLDFTKNQVLADLTTATGSFAQFAVYDFVLSQPLKLNLSGGISLIENVNQLHLTSAAVDSFASTLGIAGTLKNALADLDFGAINNTIVPSIRWGGVKTAAAVPEPSTYALLVLGLASATLIARRRAAAAARA